MQRHLGAFLSILIAGAAAAQAPLPAAQVDRAIALTRPSATKKILNARVLPRWIEGQDSFWYARDLADGGDIAIVDATTGQKRAAFDRAELSAAINAATGTPPADPKRLPVSDIGLTPEGSVRARVAAGKDTLLCTIAAATSCVKDERAKPDHGLLLAPDGTRGVFVRGDNLWLRDMATGAERQLTTDGVANHGYGLPADSNGPYHLIRQRTGQPQPPYLASWSPDSRQLILPRIDQRHVAPYPYIEYVPRDGSFRPKAHETRLSMPGEALATAQWLLIDTDSGRQRPIAYPDDTLTPHAEGRSYLTTWWADGGRKILQLALANDLRRGVLFETDVATAKARTVLTEPSDGARGLNIFNAGGYGPPAFRILSDGREALLYSHRSGWGHLYLYDVASGRLKARVTKGDWLVRDILRVDEKSRQVWFTAAGREGGSPYNRRIYRVGLDGKGLTLLTPAAADHMVIDPANPSEFDLTRGYQPFSPSGRYMVFDVSTVAEPTRSEIRHADTGALVSTFEKADVSALVAAGYRPPEELTVKAADGQLLYGLVYRPSDYDPKKRYPVIDMQYGSPTVAITPRNYNAAATFPLDWVPPAANAELGFIVVVVDSRGTPNRSEAFSRPPPGYLADMGLTDHIAFLKEVARRDPAADLSRVGISGASFGGWTAMRALIDHPGIFKVGIAGAPPGAFHNMIHAPGLTGPAGPAMFEGGSRADPTARPTNFEAFNSISQVGRMQGKLLVVMGEQDENVLPGSTMQFVGAAMKADRDVELIFVPNASHNGIYTSYATRYVWNYWLRNLAGTTLPPDTRVKGMSPD